jgi:hypothetical protein
MIVLKRYHKAISAVLRWVRINGKTITKDRERVKKLPHVIMVGEFQKR